MEIVAKNELPTTSGAKGDASAPLPINGAEAILEILQTQQTDFIFCSPIAAWAPLWEALAKRLERGVEQPRYMNCRHELLAVGLASGYYKASGKPQVVLLPVGLGVLNGSLALRAAHHERTPMTVLSPDSQTYGEDPTLDPGLEWPATLVDLNGPVRAAEVCIKWGKELKVAGDVENDLRRAFYLADLPPRGPTLLSVPFEILMRPVAPMRHAKLDAEPVMATMQTLQRVADQLAASNNPIIITEYGGRTAAQVATLTALAETLGAPVFESAIPSYHNFPRHHPLHGNGPVEEVLAEADFILSAGCNGPWHPPGLTLGEACQVAVFDEEPLRPRSPYWGYQTDYCVAGDIGLNLAALLNELQQRAVPAAEERTTRWQQYNEEIRRSWRQQADAVADAPSLQAATLFRTLHSELPEDAIIVDEIIAHAPSMLQWLFESKSMRQIHGFCGGLGTGIPTALGVKLAEPDKVVVCLIGDGAFQYNPVPACFGFSQQYDVPLLIVICNNERYDSQSWNVAKYFPEGAAMTSGNSFGDVIEPTPDYASLASAYGGHGERVDTPAQLESAIRRGLEQVKQNRFALLDVIVQGG